MNEHAAVLFDLLARIGLEVPIRMRALNFSSNGPINVDETRTIQSTPIEGTFKPLQVLFDPTRAVNFLIDDIVMDGRSQFASRVAAAGSNFQHLHIAMDPCPKDQPIIVVVTNISAYACNCELTMLGTLLEER